MERPGPRRRGICLMRASEAKKASYFLASFLTSFLFLLSLDSSSIYKFACSHKSLTSSNHRQTCTRGQFALHDRYQQHQRECKWTCAGGGHSGAWTGHVNNSIRIRPVRVYALDGTRETLITLGVVVLETNLELDRLNEVTPVISV